VEGSLGKNVVDGRGRVAHAWDQATGGTDRSRRLSGIGNGPRGVKPVRDCRQEIAG
jgi:hypothetical protein